MCIDMCEFFCVVCCVAGRSLWVCRVTHHSVPMSCSLVSWFHRQPQGVLDMWFQTVLGFQRGCLYLLNLSAPKAYKLYYSECFHLEQGEGIGKYRLWKVSMALQGNPEQLRGKENISDMPLDRRLPPPKFKKFSSSIGTCIPGTIAARPFTEFSRSLTYFSRVLTYFPTIIFDLHFRPLPYSDL